MPTNDFIGFASAGSANIMSQADYAAAAEQTDGVQPGPASSALANKIWRQGANMAAALGALIAAQGQNALDDGDIAALTASLTTALNNQSKMVPHTFGSYNFTDTTCTNSTITNISDFTAAEDGIYFFQISMSFSSSAATGERRIIISNSTTGQNRDRYSYAIFAPISNVGMMCVFCYIASLSANQKIYFNAYQTSGSSLTIGGGYRAYWLGAKQ